MRVLLCLLITIVTTGLGRPAAAAAPPKWQSTVPTFAKAPADWINLIHELQKRNLNHGVMAAATRMLVFFQDLEIKETAYKAIINTADKGYPYSVLPQFQAGDLTPATTEYDFANSYNLYKSVLNEEKGLARWARHYMEQVDKESFEKYAFYLAIEAYARRDFKTVEEKLKAILAKDGAEGVSTGKGAPSTAVKKTAEEKAPFIRKVARTLARAYFEQEYYAKSFDIYQNFLLKLNPATPADWIEAAWNLYYMKKYQDAIGMLYNAESQAMGDAGLSLEKFTIRALAHRSLCAVPNAESLIAEFDREFGETIKGIKRGKELKKLPQLAILDIPANSEYLQLATTIRRLKEEQGLIGALPEAPRRLAEYLYGTEVSMMGRRWKARTGEALERAAEKLILMDESLRFLKFDVQREKYNPETVFRPLEDAERPTIVETGSNYQIHWLQYGDFWRDERIKYSGILPNRCFE